MDYVLKAVGILILVLGVVNAVSPAIIRKFIEFAKVDKRVYVGGVVRIVIGILLLLATKSASLPLIPAIIGALILVSGILIFALGVTRIHAFLDWLLKQPDSKLRIAPIIAACVGVLLIYSA